MLKMLDHPSCRHQYSFPCTVLTLTTFTHAGAFLQPPSAHATLPAANCDTFFSTMLKTTLQPALAESRLCGSREVERQLTTMWKARLNTTQGTATRRGTLRKRKTCFSLLLSRARSHRALRCHSSLVTFFMRLQRYLFPKIQLRNEQQQIIRMLKAHESSKPSMDEHLLAAMTASMIITATCTRPNTRIPAAGLLDFSSQ